MDGIKIDDLGLQTVKNQLFPEGWKEGDEPVYELFKGYVTRASAECPKCCKRLEATSTVDAELVALNTDGPAFRAQEDRALLENLPTPAQLAEKCNGPGGDHGSTFGS